MNDDLHDFLTPIPFGTDMVEGPAMRLPREVEAEVQRQLEEFALHRARALISSRNYIVR